MEQPTRYVSSKDEATEMAQRMTIDAAQFGCESSIEYKDIECSVTVTVFSDKLKQINTVIVHKTEGC